MTARRMHRGLALALGVFLILHLGNHLTGLLGQRTHQLAQDVLRPLYLNPIVEPVLIGLFALQAGLGLVLLFRRRRVTMQTVAGGFLALFLLIHVGTVLTARLQGTDTDLAFAAAGLHAAPPWPAIFAVYYFSAVLALFAHLSRPFGRRFGPVAAKTALGLGAGVALALTLLLAGRIVPLAIPSTLIAAFP